MKRTIRKKLALSRESLRTLDAGKLDQVVGARSLGLSECECTVRYTSCLECFQNPPRPESYPCSESCANC